MNLIPISVYDFKHGNLWSALAPLMGKTDTGAWELFCTKFNSEQLLFETFFIVTLFLAVLNPKVNLIFHFCTIYDFKNTDLWRPLAPFVWEMGISARELFCLKFNSKQLLFEAFFDIMRILGSVES